MKRWHIFCPLYMYLWLSIKQNTESVPASRKKTHSTSLNCCNRLFMKNTIPDAYQNNFCIYSLSLKPSLRILIPTCVQIHSSSFSKVSKIMAGDSALQHIVLTMILFTVSTLSLTHSNATKGMLNGTEHKILWKPNSFENASKTGDMLFLGFPSLRRSRDDYCNFSMKKGQGKRQFMPKISNLHKLYICRIVHMWGRWAMTAGCQLAAFFGRCSLKPISEFSLIFPGCLD